MTEFALHPRLAADTAMVADWPLSRLLIMDDARYPAVVLVPRRPGTVEFFDLDPADQVLLCGEIARAAGGLKRLTGCAKINIAMLGNIVPQLHIHVVARNPDDEAWPGPVWGKGQRLPYAPDELAQFRQRVVNTF